MDLTYIRRENDTTVHVRKMMKTWCGKGTWAGWNVVTEFADSDVCRACREAFLEGDEQTPALDTSQPFSIPGPGAERLSCTLTGNTRTDQVTGILLYEVRLGATGEIKEVPVTSLRRA